MATYKYLFGPTKTGRITAEIPCYGGYITDKLNDVGYMQGSFQLDQTGKTNDELVSSTIPGASWVAVLRNEVLIWAGFLTSRTYQAQSKSIQFYAKTLEGHLENRLVTSTGFVGETFVNTNIDQGQIFWNLLQRLATVPPCLIDIYDLQGQNVLPAPVTGILKTVNLGPKAFKTYRDVVDELANTDDGFDWRFRPILELDPYNPQQLQLRRVVVEFGYPNLGIIPGTSSKVFEYPGNILNYYRTDNLSGAGTFIYGLGAGSGDDMLVYGITSGAGSTFFSKTEVVPLKHITTQAILEARVRQEATKRKPPRTQYKVTLRPEKDPVFGTWSIGETVQLIIKDAMHPFGFSKAVRISEYALTPSSEESPEEVNISFVGDFE